MSIILFLPQGTAVASDESYLNDTAALYAEDGVITTTPQALVDRWGSVRFSDEEDPASSEAIGVGDALTTLLTTGITNGDFAQPPESGDYISDENPLPGWFSTLTGSASIAHVADSGAPSGYAVRFTFNDATAGDEAYIEQIIPWSAALMVPIVRIGTCTATNYYLTARLSVTFLASDGTTVGDTAVSFRRFSTSATDPYDRDLYTDAPAPETARYARIRIGIQATSSGSGSIDVRSVTTRLPFVYHATPVFSGTSLTAGQSNTVVMVASTADGDVTGVAARYVAPRAGWVDAISVKLYPSRTAGSCTFSAYSSALDADFGPLATIGSADDTTTFEVSAGGSQWFNAGHQLRVTAIPSGAFAPTSSDYVVILHLSMIDL